MKRKILLPFILAIFAFPLAAQPIPSKMNKFHHNKHNFQRYHEKDLDLRFLNLSNEQTTTIHAIADEYKKKIEELEDKISRLQKDNVSKDNSNNPPGKSDEEILDDITRSFM